MFDIEADHADVDRLKFGNRWMVVDVLCLVKLFDALVVGVL